MANPDSWMNKQQKIGWLMMAIAVVFLWWRLAIVVHGQGFGSFSHDQPFLAAGISSTTIPGNPILAWWVADDMTTNAGVATLQDRSGNGYHLTNSDSTVWWPTKMSNQLNGHCTLRFGTYLNPSNYLKSVLLTNTQPFEVAYLMCYDGDLRASPRQQDFYDSLVADPRAEGIIDNEQYRQIWATTNAAVSARSRGIEMTNRWWLYNDVFDGANSKILTNNVQLVAATIGSNGCFNGFMLGGDLYGGAYSSMRVAEMVIYTAAQSAALRTNIYNYFVAKYDPFGTNDPTHVNGLSPIHYYVAEDFYTNGPRSVWPDRFLAYDLTNTANAASPTRLDNTLNGYSVVNFDGNDYLQSTLYTNSTSCEIVYVLKTPTVGDVHFYNAATNVQRQVSGFYTASTIGKFIWAGSYVQNNMTAASFSNRWWVINDVWNNSGSAIYTNGVVSVNGNPGVGTRDGLTMGASVVLDNFATMQQPVWMVFRRPLLDAEKTALYNSLKNKYGL